MTAEDLRERVEALEVTVARLERERLAEKTETGPSQPWWKRIVGIYKDDPEFDAAEQLGRAYREAQRPHGADEP